MGVQAFLEFAQNILHIVFSSILVNKHFKDFSAVQHIDKVIQILLSAILHYKFSLMVKLNETVHLACNHFLFFWIFFFKFKELHKSFLVGTIGNDVITFVNDKGFTYIKDFLFHSFTS